MIKTLDQIVDKVLSLKKVQRLAVAWAQDYNTISAVHKAVSNGFIKAILIGKAFEINRICKSEGFSAKLFTIIDIDSEIKATIEAVSLVRSGHADIVMKGLISTEKFLKIVMNKEKGLMSPDAILSYVGVIEVPAYHKLLFVTDPAVIPFPDLDHKIAMAEYALDMAIKFGIKIPKIALIGASEKVSRRFANSYDYAIMCKMAERGQFKTCVMDGPLDLFLACNKKSAVIKGVTTSINGDADILIFPSLESCNPFYKSLILFGNGEIAGLIRGTTRPVVVMSRSESEKSKYYCIALSCLMS